MPKLNVWLACVLLSTLPSWAAESPATKPAAATTAAEGKGLARFPTFGAAFELPAGWAEIPREKPGRVGQWISPGSKPTEIKSLIMIETGRPGSGASAEVLARSLARNFGGIVMDEPTTLGGEPALVVRAENHDDELAPTEGVVCLRGGNVYLVMGGVTKGRDVRKEVEAIRRSWRWTAVEKPAEHLAFRDKPFAAFGGSVELNVPALMHANPPDDPETQLDLALYNLARNNPDFRASMTLATLPPDETVDQAKDRFLAELAGKYKFAKNAPPAWQPRKGATPRYVTATVEAERPQPADTDTLHHQWAAVSLGDRTSKVVLIHFTHECDTDEERRKLEQAAERVVASVAPAEKVERAPAK